LPVLKHQERLQPSLLDRLTDNEPGRNVESREQRVISVRRLRQLVLRDLIWLLNTTHLTSSEDLSLYPEVEHSVVNFGIGELSGRLVAGMDTYELERMVRQAIVDFEPRILAKSVKVRASLRQGSEDHSSLMLEIEGDLWSLPAPTHLLVRTQNDLEQGNVTLTDDMG